MSEGRADERARMLLARWRHIWLAESLEKVGAPHNAKTDVAWVFIRQSERRRARVASGPEIGRRRQPRQEENRGRQMHGDGRSSVEVLARSRRSKGAGSRQAQSWSSRITRGGMGRVLFLMESETLGGLEAAIARLLRLVRLKCLFSERVSAARRGCQRSGDGWGRDVGRLHSRTEHG